MSDTQPHDIQAEQAVLGAMMTKPGVLAECLGMLTAGAFYRPAHQLIFEACQALSGAGTPADWLTVSAEMQRRDTLHRAGGPLYLNDCLHAVPVADNGPWYARQLLGYQAQRDLLEAAATITQAAESVALTREERADIAQEALSKALPRVAEGGPRPVAEILEETIGTLEQGAGERGLPAGLIDLDELTGGFAPGELVLIAARPGIGKSVLAAGIARNVACKRGVPVLFASLEMSSQEITLRLIAAAGRVPLHALVQRRIDAGMWPRINKAGAELAGSPLLIDDTPGMTLAGLRSRLREMARTEAARMLVVDYLGLLDGPKAENRAQAVAALSRGLKLIAREHGLPVVAAAQLNRRPEDRGERIPQLSDLRDSGAQEQDADIVILLHREDAYDRESPRAGEVDLIVAKNRQGPKATITCAFQGHYARIVDMAPILHEDENWSPSSALGGAA